MTWAKLDDGFWMHPKVLMTGNVGAGIYARMLSYCGFYLSDGHVPPPIVDTITGRDKAALESLVGTGLVKRLEDGTVVIPDWLDFNPSRAEILAKRRKDSDRKKERLQRDSARNPRGIQSESAGNPDVLARGGPRAQPVPSRPDLSPPSPPEGGRQRDRNEWGLKMNSWTATHFPGVQPSLVASLAARLRSRGVVPSVDALRPLVEEHNARNREAKEAA